MTNNSKFYDILGVDRSCDDDALKRAYKKAAIKWHPDKHASKPDAERKAAEDKFKEIATAFEVLSDKDKRAVYDRYGEEGLKAGGPAGASGSGGNMPAGFAGFPGGGSFHFSTGGGGGGGMDNARAAELFASLFGGLGGGGGGGVRVVRGGKGLSGGLGGGLGGGIFGAGGPDLMEEDDPFASMMGGGMAGMAGMGGMGGMGGRMGGMGGRMGGGRAAKAARVDTLAPGTTVRLADLNAATHNGSVGTIASFDASKGRYAVQLADGSTLSVKAENVVQVVTEATVVNTSKGELNGKTVSHATFDRASKRYRCEGLKDDGGVVSLKPENVVLPPSTRVTIDGVQSRPQLNGCVGSVQSVDVQSGRYQVQLPGEAISLRFGAVAAC